MKRVLSFCLALIMCVGMVGCGEEESKKEKLINITEELYRGGFYYSGEKENDEDNFSIFFIDVLEEEKEGFLSSLEFIDIDDSEYVINFYDNEKKSMEYFYYPSSQYVLFYVFTDYDEFDNFDSIPMLYDINEDKLHIYIDESEYENYSICNTAKENGEDCHDYLVNNLTVYESKTDSITKKVKKIKKALNECGLTLEDINVPYEELDK